MKYRGGAEHTGLGGNAATLMDCNTSGDKTMDTLIRNFSKDVYETFFKGTKLDYDGIDAQYREHEILAGIEPTYMYEYLKLIAIRKNKEYSSYETGYAVGAWASAIRQKKKYYVDYTKKSKFVRLIDKWHPILFPVVNT